MSAATARPSLAELRAAVQPPEVLARRAEHWTGDLYMRRFSVHLTRLLIRTPISANGVTGLMILSGSSAGVALLIPGAWGPLLAVVLTQLQMLLDCVDGEVARWRKTYTPAGIFLDKVGHYLAEGSLGLGLGLRASGITMGESEPVRMWQYLFAGAILMAWIWFNKALNDMVHVARAFSGLAKLAETKLAETQSRQSDVASEPGREATGPGPASPVAQVLKAARRAARFVPFHKAFHSIELSLIVLACALIGAAVGEPLAAMRVLLIVLSVAIVAVSVGHAVAIKLSPKLRS